MSYFADEPDLNDPTHCQVTELERDVEIADGVTVERRSVLLLSAAAVGAMLTGSRTVRAQDPRPQNPKPQGPEATPSNGLTYEEFLAEVLPQSRQLLSNAGKGESAYLMTVAAAMLRIRDHEAPLRQTMQAFRKQHATDGERFPLSAMAMKLGAGKGFKHHDHLDYNGVILGIEGEVRIRNYDFVGEAPALDSEKTFEIRETRDELILPGGISTLGSKRNNVHDLVAGKEGARVLDVFTFFSKRATSRWLDVEPEPVDAERRVYEARWRPRRRRR